MSLDPSARSFFNGSNVVGFIVAGAQRDAWATRRGTVSVLMSLFGARLSLIHHQMPQLTAIIFRQSLWYFLFTIYSIKLSNLSKQMGKVFDIHIDTVLGLFKVKILHDSIYAWSSCAEHVNQDSIT